METRRALCYPVIDGVRAPEKSRPEVTMPHDVEAVLKKMKAAHLDLSAPVTAPPETAVAACLDRMREAKASCVLVVTGETLVGIFTERDVLNRVVGVEGAVDRPVSDFMTAGPHVIEKRDTVARAVNFMHHGKYRHLPIVEEGRLVGLVEMVDIVKFLADQYAETIFNIPPSPDQALATPEGG
jgi:CBS domain-containing protein